MEHDELFQLHCKGEFGELKEAQLKMCDTLEFIKDNMADKKRVEALEVAHYKLAGAGKLVSILFTAALALLGALAKFIPIK